MCRRLADIHDAGKLNADEFAVAMHLVHKKLLGQDLPSSLPTELIPPSQRDFDLTVEVMKEVVVNDILNKARYDNKHGSTSSLNFKDFKYDGLGKSGH